MGRYDGIVNQAITLEFIFTKDGVLYNAFEVNRVEVYSSYEDAIASQNIIETIPTGSITNTETGKYQYTVSPLSTSGTYYDKVYVIPESGMTEIYFINAFYVRAIDYGGGGITPAICYVSGYVRKKNGLPVVGAKLIPKINQTALTADGPIINTQDDDEIVETNEVGFFTLKLVRNVEFDLPGISYDLIIDYPGYNQTFTINEVPNQDTALLRDIISGRTI